FDIQHFPIITQEGTKKKLNGFHVCLKLFEDCKQNKTLKFDYFDLNQSVRSRAYFMKLEEYQIFSKEWESIIKKVNLKESGLSELFKEAKDEKGLTEKWFLDAIENKLNKEQNRMKEFEKILNKYIFQYKANEGNFKRREGILTFEELIVPLIEQENLLAQKDDDMVEFEEKIATLIQVLAFLIAEYESEQVEITTSLDSVKAKRHNIFHEEYSLAIYELEAENERLELEKQQALKIKTQYLAQYESYKKQKYCYEAANRYQTYKKASEDVQRHEVELCIAKQSNEELLPRQNDLGYTLRLMYESLVEAQEIKRQTNQTKLQDNEQNKKVIWARLESKRSDLLEYSKEKATCDTLIKQFDRQEQTFTEKYHESFLRNLEGYYEPLLLESKKQTVIDELEQLKKVRKDKLTEQNQLDENIHAFSRSLETVNQQLGTIKAQVSHSQKELDTLNEELRTRKSLLTYIAFNEEMVFETESIIQAFEGKKQHVTDRLKHLQRQLDKLTDEYNKLKTGAILELPKEIEEVLKEEGIHYVLGMEWLKKNGRTLTQNQALV
ncbi:MAG TPA: hypothetical protein DCY20_09545, partial [Firmicutes bacterium]|nr:hypothetical protein [Bacillota bacterium]